MNSLYWFDYETFGTHPAWDRPCQFAGLRTDMELNEIGQPLEILCRQSMDYLPNPAACRVTGLSPQQVNADGLNEKLFIQRIVEQIGQPGTCSLGYNSIRFDDEFTRYTLFRNFHDAYEHEYKNDNSRWDLLDVVRLTRALRPDGIVWPVSDEGKPSNRLEHLSAANGIEHGHAHDALSDVRATIGMARLIRDKQPRLYNYAFENRGKHAVSRLLNTAQADVCLLVSGMIPATRSHLAAILPLTAHAGNRNSVIVLDLDLDPTPLLTMDADEIAERVFRKTDDKTGDLMPADRLGLRTVQINKCPVVAPLNTMRPQDAERLSMDLTTINEHARIAQGLLQPDKLANIHTAMMREWPDSNPDLEGTLYSGTFLSQEDKRRAALLRDAEPGMITDIGAQFDDKRLPELARRYLARNYPEYLNEDQRESWRAHCHERLTDDAAPWLSFKQFDAAMESMEWSAGELQLAKDLSAYADMLRKYVDVNVTEPAVSS